MGDADGDRCLFTTRFIRHLTHSRRFNKVKIPPLSVDSPTQIIVVKYSSTQIHSQSPSPSPYKPLYTHSTQYKHLNKTFCPDWVAAFSSKWRHNPPANQKKTIRLTPLGHPAVPANQATSAIPPTMCPSPNICNLPRLGVGVGVLGVCP